MQFISWLTWEVELWSRELEGEGEVGREFRSRGEDGLLGSRHLDFSFNSCSVVCFRMGQCLIEELGTDRSRKWWARATARHFATEFCNTDPNKDKTWAVMSGIKQSTQSCCWQY